MRNRRRLRRLLVVTPVLALATGGFVYMASNTVAPSNAGVTTMHVDCGATTPVNCATTAAPQSP